jgi:hypothetical protein
MIFSTSILADSSLPCSSKCANSSCRTCFASAVSFCSINGRLLTLILSCTAVSSANTLELPEQRLLRRRGRHDHSRDMGVLLSYRHVRDGVAQPGGRVGQGQRIVRPTTASNLGMANGAKAHADASHSRSGQARSHDGTMSLHFFFRLFSRADSDCDQIKFILVQNRQSKTRLSKWYEPYEVTISPPPSASHCFCTAHSPLFPENSPTACSASSTHKVKLLTHPPLSSAFLPHLGNYYGRN